MKKQLLLGVAIFGAGAVINPSAFAASPVYSWTGCYVGANAGYGWGRASADTNADSLASLGLPTASSTSVKPRGFVGGGQAGCNWQYNVAVFGFETDFQGANQKASRFSSAPFNIFEGPSGNVSQHVEARLRWFGTVRARAGVLVVPSVLVYGTGGLAYGNVKVTDTIAVDGFGSTTVSTASTRTGWTAGFGVEGLFPNAPQWTWKVEYLHIDLGSFNGAATDPLGGTVTWSGKFTEDIVRAGFNFRFSP